MSNARVTTAVSEPAAATSAPRENGVEVSATPALSVRGLSKAFGATQALSELDLDIERGEIHALLGENGSGKSTLIKILSGYHRPDSGEIHVWGDKLTTGSSKASQDLGCRFVHQDLGLIATETVLDNLCAGIGYETILGTINPRAARRAAIVDLERVGIDLDPKRVVGTLSPAEQTAVALARALRPASGSEARLLVLDEPTARLPQKEVAQLLDIVRGIAAKGVAVIYVSHRIDEVMTVAQTATVLRDGIKVATRRVADLDRRELVDLLVGDAMKDVDVAADSAPPPDSPALLEVAGLRSAQLKDVSFDVRQGEVVGIAGITGSGREVVLSTVFGGAPPRAGTVRVDGTSIKSGRPDLAIGAGVAYLPPDRKTAGGLVEHTARENLMLADLRSNWRWPAISRRGERKESLTWFQRLNVRPADNVELPFGNFSGGNQQKILFGKWLRTKPKVLLLDEPTQGVDIATKADLHREILAVAEAGACVVVSSSDTEELIAVCHRILVMRGGRIVGTLSGKDKTVVNLSHTSHGSSGVAAK